jgi:hypothetical protein
MIVAKRHASPVAVAVTKFVLHPVWQRLHFDSVAVIVGVAGQRSLAHGAVTVDTVIHCGTGGQLVTTSAHTTMLSVLKAPRVHGKSYSRRELLWLSCRRSKRPS